MKKITILSLTIVIFLFLNTIPVISQDINPDYNKIIPLGQVLYPKQDKMKYIPFQQQEKPEFLSLTQSTVNYPPNGNVIVVQIKRIRLLDESITNPEYTVSITIDGTEASRLDGSITERESWFEWPIGYIFLEEYSESSIPIEIGIMVKNKFWFDTPGDLSPGSEKTLSLTFDPKRGDWTGDDQLGDISGYGHASGYDDGNFDEKDFEIWFEIYQMEVYNNYYLDGDKLTYWEETNMYESDPFIYDGDSEKLLQLCERLSQGSSLLDKDHIREGVVLRVEAPNVDTHYKYKSFWFCELEGIAKNSDEYVDPEEIS